jgi:putative ABC transport system substrate-binding protein
LVLFYHCVGAQQDGRGHIEAERLGGLKIDKLRRIARFLHTLQELGWTDGGNVRIDVRWGAGNADRFRNYSRELVSLAPDVILAGSGGRMVALL